MFNLTTTVRSPYQALAMLVSVAVLLWSVGAYTTAQAANLVELSNTLTDSAPSATAGHTIEFTVPTGSDIDGNIVIDFPTDFTDATNIDDADVAVTFSDSGSYGSATGGADQLTIDTVVAAAEEVVTIVVDPGIVSNPASTGSYEFTVTTDTSSGTDVGNTRVAIVDTVTVTASIETTFDFVISGVGTSSSINADTTTGSTTATEIPFGVLSPGTAETLAQDLAVTTNAGNGFVVTVEQDQNLLSATGADIDGFIDGAYTDSPTAWAAPTEDVNDENSWGHWGLTSNDSDLATNLGGATNRDFSNDGYVAASTTPVEVFAHNGPSDGSTVDIGTATVGYKIEVSALQEAANDYTTTLTYIATPTF